jgi:uncharacterized membrane protein
MEPNQNQSVPPVTPVPPVNESGQIDNDKLWGVLAYILFLIPLLAVKNRSAFLNFHINQGIILLLVSIVGNFGLDFLPWWLGIMAFFKGLWNLAMLTLLIIGIKNVLEKKMVTLPVIGKLFTFLK